MYPPGPKSLYKYLESIVRNGILEPIVVGISAPQGSGKTFAVEQSKRFLNEQFPKLNVVTLLLDDVYLTHEKQTELTQYAKSVDNKLLQGRGLPGTHELSLLQDIINKVKQKSAIAVPQYDKSAFNGEGDRLPKELWPLLDNVDLVLIEGWFIGYQPLSKDTLIAKYNSLPPDSAAKSNKLEHLLDINARLKDYVPIWQSFDYFVNFETNDINNVFTWRLQQEHDLIKKKGSGMTDDQVRQFINRYMAMYELYYQDLCESSEVKVRIDINRNEY